MNGSLKHRKQEVIRDPKHLPKMRLPPDKYNCDMYILKNSLNPNMDQNLITCF